MKNLINKLKKSKVISLPDEASIQEATMGETFMEELMMDMGNRYCIADKAIDFKAEGVKKGTIPYVKSKSYIGNTDELGVNIGITSFDISKMRAIVPVNATMERMATEAFKNFTTKLLAKEIVERLNAKAFNKIATTCTNVTGAFDRAKVIDAVVNKAVGRENGIVLCSPELVDDVLPVQDKMELYGVKVIPVTGINGKIIVGDLDYLYYVHNDEQQISVHEEFLAERKDIYFEEYNDFAVAFTEAFVTFTITQG